MAGVCLMSIPHILAHWQAVRAGLLETIDKFTDGDLDFRPFASGWTVRQLMLHIAQEERGELGYGIVQSLPEFPPEYPPEAYPTIEAIKGPLASVHASSIDFLTTRREDQLEQVIQTPWGASYRLAEMIDHLIDHEVHHRAELSLILGMLGKTGFDA
jgi:uncharacterized damage-inducible protein DinB